MKVMTWNLLVGGGDRLDRIRAVVERERPDVLALQELRGWTRGLPVDLGMTAHVAPSVFGQPVAVLVRPPLTFTATKSVRWRLHHAAAVATIGDLTVVSTHLNAISPERRRREATWLAARFGSRTRKVLIAGDLNSLHPGADHTESLSRLAPRYRHRHTTRAGDADTRAMAAFFAAGFTDLGAGTGPTAPTTGVGGAEFADFRLDYLLASPALAGQVRDVRVLRDPETDDASDHYPVVATFDPSAP